MGEMPGGTMTVYRSTDDDEDGDWLVDVDEKPTADGPSPRPRRSWTG
jgi:hypothetical protein